MRVSTSLSDGEIVLLWELLSKLMSGSDPKLLVKNASFPKLVQSVRRLKERADPDPSKRPPVKPRPKKDQAVAVATIADVPAATVSTTYPPVGSEPDPNVFR